MATQRALAKHINISERKLRDVLVKIGITDSSSVSVDEFRIKYIMHLRDVAGGRGGDLQEEATRAKIRELESRAQHRELQYHKEIGELVPVEEIEPLLSIWAIQSRSEVTNAVDKLLAYISSKHGVHIDEEIIDESLIPAYEAIAGYPSHVSPDDFSGSEALDTPA